LARARLNLTGDVDHGAHHRVCRARRRRPVLGSLACLAPERRRVVCGTGGSLDRCPGRPARQRSRRGHRSAGQGPATCILTTFFPSFPWCPMGRTLIVIGLLIAGLSCAPLILFLAVNTDPTANPVGHGVLAWLGTPVGLVLAGIGAAIALLRDKQR